MLPARSIASWPLDLDTSMLRSLPWVTRTWPLATAPVHNSASHKPLQAAQVLTGTIHLQILQFVIVGFERNLHWLATNLAVFDVGLTTRGGVDKNAHAFGTKRATDTTFNNACVHEARFYSGLESGSGPCRCLKFAPGLWRDSACPETAVVYTIFSLNPQFYR